MQSKNIIITVTILLLILASPVIGVSISLLYVEITNVSSFEGGSGYAFLYLSFVTVPACFVVGLLFSFAMIFNTETKAHILKSYGWYWGILGTALLIFSVILIAQF